MAEDWREVAPAQWSAATRREIGLIATVDGVIVNSINVFVSPTPPEDAPAFAFQIRFDIAAPGITEPEVAFQDPEPIALAWIDEGQVGFSAPLVFCLRPDFPRDVPHLYAAPPGWPACPCLALAGLTAIYQRFGCAGVVERLRGWFLDAAAGTLDADGWHPVPQLSSTREFAQVMLDIAFLQEIAAKGSAGGSVAGVGFGTGPLAYLSPQVASMETENGRASEFFKQYAGTDKGEPIPWALVWTPTPESARVFSRFTKLEQLLTTLDQVGVGTAAQMAMVQIEATLDNNWRRSSSGDKALLLIVAVRRPQPLKDGIPGLSEDKEARCYELGAYLVKASANGGILDGGNPVDRAVLKPWLNAAMFRHVSGTPKLVETTIIGAGALGSAVIEQLVRTGVDDLVAADKDFIEPHNLPRHGAKRRDIGHSKAAWVNSLGEQLSAPIPPANSAGHKEAVRGVHLDVLTASDEELREVLHERVVLDTTADPWVRTRLCDLPNIQPRRFLRAEIFDQGKLGVFYVGGAAGNPDPFDLYWSLCALAPSSDPVRRWLAHERNGALALNELVTGIGCASATVRLPGWVVAQHATSLMPALIAYLRSDGSAGEAGIGINSLDEQLRPLGWTWHAIREFHEHVLRSAGWKVRIAPEVLEQVRLLRAEAGGNETGGYLFGGWDRHLQRITVVAVTPAPPGTQGTPSDLDLKAVWSCPKAKALVRRTAGRLHLVGTWHSHPDGHSEASEQDLTTISVFALQNAERGLPTLMLIQSDKGEPALAFCDGELK